jgi:polysaccharide biosynthesis protein PslG
MLLRKRKLRLFITAFALITYIFILIISLSSHAQNYLQSYKTIPNGLGVDIHFTKPRYGEMKMLADAGFKWIRTGLYWHLTELSKGVYDFSEYDILLSHLQKYRIRPVFAFVYTNPLYDHNFSPNTKEGRKAFADWATAAAMHFKDRGILWETYNEPDAGGWSPKANASDYTKLALAVGESFHLHTPKELLIGPSVSSTLQLPFLEACFKAGLLKYWAAVSVHPYRKEVPETVSEDYRKIRLLIDRYATPGKNIPIISGEWGYPSSSSLPWGELILNEDIQGKHIARQFLINSYNSIPLSFWYDWQDDGSDLQNPEHNFGLVHYGYDKYHRPVIKPKNSYFAVQALSKVLSGFIYQKRVDAGGSNDYILRFVDPLTNQSKLAAWTSSLIPHTISLPINKGYRIVNYIGQEKEYILPKKGHLLLTLTDAPQYLIPR